MSEEIVNKVASSGIIQLDLEQMFPVSDCIVFDIAQTLYEGLILREKDFREFVKQNDWSVYRNKYVRLTCTADAIVPTWAYMLLVTAIQPYAKKVVYASEEMMNTIVWMDIIDNFNLNEYNDARVVVKGCSSIPLPETAFSYLTAKLTPVVKSLMFGEPCSTVPLYKKK